MRINTAQGDFFKHAIRIYALSEKYIEFLKLFENFLFGYFQFYRYYF